MTDTDEIDESVAGSPEVIGRRSREAFEAAVTRACTCPLELRIELRTGVECAKCGAAMTLRKGGAWRASIS